MQPPLSTEITPTPMRTKRLTAIAWAAASKFTLALAAVGLTLAIINPPGIGLPLTFTALVAYLVLADLRLDGRGKAGED